ncbi:hypothetical protein COU17_02010 [Candidatus Kaiserbacteria bacterium CG10_big_fil_rev_8_21_14_0_10_49_17]|uniref:Uncharacterized protein n=1 Tax=Candidatus Kaiserbacteria bacterium CG10_big_fil_rev_8_21_14_0_10_49_17 TaxID=1974609 RepID=A0A2M6WEI2_9BACT|nr:MAG: hypothetical protein COU17_02010 [Candidatus Kaiserbacteria bacterium CG10_big_fil_rev_8_21_14_0_10_49_17]
MQALLHRKWILIVVALLIAGGTWYGLSASSPSSPLVTTPIAAVANPAEQGLIATLLTLRAVKLDGTILTDPVFMSLKDFSTQIVEEPVGRDNPFAPLSSQSVPSVSSTQGAQIFKPL